MSVRSPGSVSRCNLQNQYPPPTPTPLGSALSSWLSDLAWVALPSWTTVLYSGSIAGRCMCFMLFQVGLVLRSVRVDLSSS